jgi:diadenosine tetraphosphate (Ap4A) HIT family hydrolase
MRDRSSVKNDMHKQTACPFCNPDKSKVILANGHAIAFHDGFPDTPGHSLIVPKRHIASFFEATREEQAALFDLLAEMQIMGSTEMAFYESCR